MRFGTKRPQDSNYFNQEVSLNELLGVFLSGTTGDADVTSVGDEIASTTLLAANADRRGFILFNDSTAICYVKFGVTASTTSFTVRLTPYAVYVSDFPVYRGFITGIWSADSGGSMRITEIE